MPHAFYPRIPVRDALAAERTLLAAERTFLAYLRSSFALFVTGITGAEIFESTWIAAVAHALSASSVVALGVGIVRYRAARRIIGELLARIGEEPDGGAG